MHEGKNYKLTSAKPNQDASSFIMIMAENARSTSHARL